MKTLRTPDERFTGVPDWPFEPRYAELDDLDGGTLRVHYVDEGPADAAPVLLMHGEPSWSFLYRHMIQVLVDAGHRVVAPDLVGFGRSDKPSEQADYTYARHVEWMRELLFDQLDLRHITYFGQDWGGLIGPPARGARPRPVQPPRRRQHGPADRRRPDQRRVHELAEVLAGIAGVPDRQHHRRRIDHRAHPRRDRGLRRPVPRRLVQGRRPDLPSLVPTMPDDPAHDDNVAAWEVLSRFERPVLTCFSDSDPVTVGGAAVFLDRVPGTAGQAHTTIEGGGHFLQEDRGPELARVLVDFIGST